MKVKKNKNNLINLILFVLCFEFIFISSICCFENKFKNSQNPFLEINSNKISMNNKTNNQKILKINLKEKEINAHNSFFQMEKKDEILMNFDVSLGVKEYLHFHPSVNILF